MSAQIQTIKYGLNVTKRIHKKQDTLIIYSFTPSDMNFQTFLLPNVILAKKTHKKSTHLDHYYLKYTLVSNNILLAVRKVKFKFDAGNFYKNHDPC